MVGPDFSDWLTKVLIKIKTVKHQIKATPTPMPFTLMKIFKLKLLILIITIIIIEETWPRCHFIPAQGTENDSYVVSICFLGQLPPRDYSECEIKNYPQLILNIKLFSKLK